MSSWAEQYEAKKKAATMKEEQIRLNKNLGFGFSLKSSELGEVSMKAKGM